MIVILFVWLGEILMDESGNNPDTPSSDDGNVTREDSSFWSLGFVSVPSGDSLKGGKCSHQLIDVLTG